MKKISAAVFSMIPLFAVSVSLANPSNTTTNKPVQTSCIVTAMTFNIRVDTLLDAVGNSWSSRKQIVVDTIVRNTPDVIGLQESLEKQVRDVMEGLPAYGGYSVGRSDGRQKGESCAILYRKDRFKLIDYGTFWFSNTPEKPGSKHWGNIPPRICSWVRLGDTRSGKAFYVYNLHLDNLSQNSRKKSIKLLAARIAKRKTKDPFIVMGDFNMKIDNPAMKYLCGGNYPKIKDTWRSLYPLREKGTGTSHNFGGGINGPRIDHIPICQNARALEIKIDRYNKNGKYPSDHFPVIAKIQLAK